MAKITTIEELREVLHNREKFNWYEGSVQRDPEDYTEDYLLRHVVYYHWTAERKPWEPEPGKLIYVRLNHGFWTVRRFVGMQDDLFITEPPDAPSPNVVPDQSWPHAKPIDPTEASK